MAAGALAGGAGTTALNAVTYLDMAVRGRPASSTPALAMLVGNGPMVVLGVTDPRSWSGLDWLADVVPHLAYAAAATAVLV